MEGAFLVDVRSPGEFASGSVNGAVNIPLDRIAGELSRLKGKSNVVVFCRSGNRSARASACLRRLGHAAAWQLNGGMAMAEATRHPLAIAA